MKRLVIILLLSTLSPCYAEVKREELVSYSLDYYNLKVHSDKEKAQKEKEELTVKQEKMEVQKKQESEAQEARSEKVKKFLTAVVKNIHYTASLEQVYNDNIYRVHTNAVSGFITHPNIDLSYRPQEGMSWKGGHTTFLFDASGGPGLKTSNTNSIGRIGGLPTFTANSVLMNKRGKYTVSGSYGYERHFCALSDIVTSAYMSANRPDLGDRSDDDILVGINDLNKAVYYWRKPYGAKLSADWNRIPVDFEYAHVDDVYPEDYQGSNVTTDRFTLTNYFNAFTKTQLLFSYEYERNKYPFRDNDDSTTTTYWTGVKGKISPKLRGLIQVGFAIRNPEDKEIGKEYTTTVKTNLDYKLSQALSANLSVGRRYEITPYGNQDYAKTLGTKLGLHYQPYFNRKLGFGTAVGLTQIKYARDRSDSVYDYRLYSEYAWRKWLKFIGEYEYAYRMSNKDFYEYKNNIITMKLVSEF